MTIFFNRAGRALRSPGSGRLMGKVLIWERDGHDWPNRQASRFVRAAGIRWHLQEMGHGPVLLLLHGTGASTHSWRRLAPLLATRFSVVAPDLPGHAFTEMPQAELLSLSGMARALAQLLGTLGQTPAVVAGHSAGAAVLARMTLDHSIDARALICLNGALLPLAGLAGRVFSPIAKFLVTTSLAPRLFAWRAAEEGVVERVIENTGSKLDAAGLALYRRLAASPGHVAAALAMMANWDLAPLERDLPRLRTPSLLVVGANDLSVPPSQAFQVCDLLPSASVSYLRGLGHLAHEEQPDMVATKMIQFACNQGVFTDESSP
jgi:magnesium chelatase accessory protein